MELHEIQLYLGLIRENVQSDTKLRPRSISDPQEENSVTAKYSEVMLPDIRKKKTLGTASGMVYENLR